MIETQTIKKPKIYHHETPADPVIHTRNLTIGYQLKRKNKAVAKNMDLALCPGELVCLLGPNGSGKSTLMRTLAGIQPALSGEIYLRDQPLNTCSKKRLSREMSLVLTEKQRAGNLSVYSILTLGRYPYLNWFGQLRNEDKEIIKWAIKKTGIAPLINNHIDKLSDGEKQKVMIARALVQETPLIILDEPTAHLDLLNRIEIMRLLKNMARDTGKAILLSTHELDLALQAADIIWLMMPDQSLKSGGPEDLILNGTFESAFKKRGFRFDSQSGTFKFNPWDGKKTIALEGGQVTHVWTRRALEREGYGIVPGGNLKVSICENEGQTQWQVECGPEAYEFSLLEQVIKFLRCHDHAKRNENGRINSEN